MNDLALCPQLLHLACTLGLLGLGFTKDGFVSVPGRDGVGDGVFEDFGGQDRSNDSMWSGCSVTKVREQVDDLVDSLVLLGEALGVVDAPVLLFKVEDAPLNQAFLLGPFGLRWRGGSDRGSWRCGREWRGLGRRRVLVYLNGVIGGYDDHSWAGLVHGDRDG